ncbi:hypothetical protein OSB04_004185 [Centaurea solstitialis]|uniref:Uncharacterized protein n=1 Tax=Centaurea solstitialis TaxID=347529 RepID=A0AA38WVI3_9ASTR|nr:hypothetical protein OSB04_004185 [Centaurea solstitialis]
MEFDEAEALRTKEAAERRFLEGDYIGASFFAQKAIRLCPWLNYMSIFITIIDIYSSKEEVKNGQASWHRVLKLEEDSANIAKKCQNFCNLVEIVQSGLDIVIGAEGAFQILSEAFCNVTDTFWTRCSHCRFQFQYASFRVYTELVCRNCKECFVAVPLPSGYHPTDQRTMSQLRRTEDRSVVIALKATKSSKQSKRMKKDDGYAYREPGLSGLKPAGLWYAAADVGGLGGGRVGQPAALTTSKRLADRKVERFEKNIKKRGSVPETTTKKKDSYPVGPIVLGFFIFVVIGS